MVLLGDGAPIANCRDNYMATARYSSRVAVLCSFRISVPPFDLRLFDRLHFSLFRKELFKEQLEY